MGNLIDLLKPKYMPVAIYRLDKIPDYGEPAEKGHCIVERLLLPSLGGKTVYADRERLGCAGALNGLGFGGEDPEHRENLLKIYSSGSEERPGRSFFCCPEIAHHNYADMIPVYGDGSGCIVFQPLDEAEKMGAPIETVMFLVDPLEYSALMTLAMFSRETGDSVLRSGFGLSCEQIYAMPRQEGESEVPRMVFALTEFYTRRYFDDERFGISMPFKLYKLMDEDCPFSFLKDDRWREAAKPKCDKCC